MFCIEIDEDQHKKYIKYDENIRYDALFLDFTGKYIYIYDTTPINSLINTTSQKIHFFNKRMDLLENNINKHINIIENGLNISLNSQFIL